MVKSITGIFFVRYVFPSVFDHIDCCLAQMIIGLVPVFIVTVMLILNFVHCEITACDSDNKLSLILSFHD